MTLDLLLSVNAGSSSLKISLYQQSHNASEAVNIVLTSSISSITAPPALFSFQLSSTGKPSAKDEPCDAITDHTTAFAHFLQSLHTHASIQADRVIYICHRVVHGGDYNKPILITQDSYDHLEKLSDLAPLHNGAALSVIKACMDALPKSKSIAYFDTSFHSTLPIHVSSYAINQDIGKNRGLKKYGFHGLSC
jgi:acetate kinase